MPKLWIVHREEAGRAALAQLAAAPDAVVGPPGDPRFGAAAAPAAVILGLGAGADWEGELEFAHRQRGRLAGTRWVLVGEASQADTARALFDQLAFDFLAYPPQPEALRRLIRPDPPRRPTLSQRARRERVAARFALGFGTLELPELLRALDPRLADVPVRISGEPGSGRATLVRYLHHFGGTGGGELLHWPCSARARVAELERALAAATGPARAGSPPASLCVWLDAADRLDPRTQRELAAWLEAGPPPGVRVPTLRWLASVDITRPPLDPDLAHALGGLEIRVPPLRERAGEIPDLVAALTDAWTRARREPPRRFDVDALAQLTRYPWPGNLRELETRVERTLAASSAEVLRADDLARAGLASEPPDVAEPALRPDTPLDTAAAPGPPGEGDPDLRRLASALIDQVRNPLATIRTFAELLPERFDDPEFRARFPEMVREDVGRIHGLLGRLEQLAALDAPRREKVDVSALLEALLDDRREACHRRQLLVLKELDASRPWALADPDQLRLAFEALLDKVLGTVPLRGDVYIASRHHEAGRGGEPAVRVLLRYPDPDGSTPDDSAPLEHSIELLVAELLVRAQGGRLTLGSSEGEEGIAVVDLPAD